MKRLYAFTLCTAVLLTNCTAIERKIDVKTYIVSTEKLAEVKAILGVEECSKGKSALAMTVESAQGGATVTIKCQ